MASLSEEYVASVQEAVALGYDKDQLREYLHELNRWLSKACADRLTYYRVLTDAEEALSNLYTNPKEET